MTQVLTMLQSLLSTRSGFILVLLLSEIIFSLHEKPRKIHTHFPAWLSLPLAIVSYLVICYNMPRIPFGDYTASVSTLPLFAVSVLLMWAVLDIPLKRAIFIGTAAYLAQNLSLNMYEVMHNILGTTDWWDLLLNLGVIALVLTCCYFTFVRQFRNSALTISWRKLLVILLVSLFICNWLFNFQAARGETSFIIKIPLAICCALMLQVQFSTFWGENLNRDKELLEKLLYREQQQHELRKETMEIMNLKGHDLKNLVARVKTQLDGGYQDLISEVESAIATYDCLVDTGNRNLDLIVSEEKMFCESHQIPFEIMADGKLLDFISPADLYSLIGNALRNAVESSLLEDEAHRSICLDIHTARGYVLIDLSNYCTRKVVFSDGLPTTSKADSRMHGYGMKSIRYVVKKYGGHMVVQHKDDLFTLKIILPRQTA